MGDLKGHFSGFDDSGLVQEYRAGNELAFSALVERYKFGLHNFFRRRCGDDRAEDLVQDTWLRVCRYLPSYDTSKKFYSWVYTIANNIAKNELRGRSRSFIILEGTLESRTDADFSVDSPPLRYVLNDEFFYRYSPDRAFDKTSLHDVVVSCVHQIPSTYRDTFVLRDLRGLSYEEIAEITGANMGTVKSRVSRARDAFKELITPYLI